MSPIKARHVRFDFSNTPLHWVPGAPHTTHLLNFLHLLTPEAERRFVQIYKDVLPFVRDESLKADMKGFMGQEASHARAHNAFLEHLKDCGVDPDEFLTMYAGLWERLAGETPTVPMPDDWWRLWRLAVVAAGEQMTCAMGDWVLKAEGLDAAQADPVMLEMFRWHGAEEVEHRSVAIDVLRHLAGPAELPLRLGAMALVFPVILALWGHGAGQLVERDASLAGHPLHFGHYLEALQKGRVPGIELITAAVRYMDPLFHPAGEGSLEEALAFFATSPAVRTASA